MRTVPPEQPQACAECGMTPSPGQSFCDGCGAVLHWAPGPTHVDVPADNAANAAADSAADSAALGAAHKAEAHDDTKDTKDTDDSEDSEPPKPPKDSEPPEPMDPVTERARALLVEVADSQGGDEEGQSVAPVLPGRAATARLRVNAPAPDLGDDGPSPCPWCQTGNRPDRHFCRRCAMPMSGGSPQIAGRRPWWRRLLDRKNREAPWAGDRPRLRRGVGRLLTWLAGAAVIALLVAAVLNSGAAVQAVRDHFANRVQVIPDSWRASRSYPGHGPGKAFDEISNTWWGPGVSGSGEGQWIEAHFQQPVRLLDLIITPGVSAKADQLSQSALPHLIEARITTVDGRTTTRNLTLDQGGVQRRSFHADNVTAVRFTLRSAYGTDQSKQVAIAEIEFFGPSVSSSS